MNFLTCVFKVFANIAAVIDDDPAPTEPYPIVMIDNFICKFSPAIMKSTTGILTNNNISDHQPYLINIHNLTTTQNTPTFVHKNTQNYNSINNFKMNIGNANILNKLKHQALLNPNDNYKTHFPICFVKYNKHKHKKARWITKGRHN